MKLLMYLLLTLNLILAMLGWLDIRKAKVEPVFSVRPGVEEIVLLGSARAAGTLAQVEEQCWLLGPIALEAEARQVESELSGIDYFAELVRSDIELAPAYWVYFGPIDSYSESLSRLREFKSKGIDSYIIKKEDLYGSISLGVFNNIDSANRMQGIMSRKGYETKIAEFPKTAVEYWVSIKVPVGGLLETNFEAYLKARKQALEARQIFCT